MQADRDPGALRWLSVALVIAAALVFVPFGPWVVLAMWTAVFTRGIADRLRRRLGNRPRLAAALTLIGLGLLTVPGIVLLSFLVVDAIDLIQRVLASDRMQEVFRQLVRGDGSSTSTSTSTSTTGVVRLVMSQGERGWQLAQQIAGTAANMVIGLVILIAGAYAMLIEGDRWYRWAEDHAPMPRQAMRRFAAAFVETGRGLFIGVVGAGLAQSIVATVVYLALDVPQALALGFLTLVFSVLPAVGTAIVWIPVAIGLALTGRTVAALILVIAGFTLIGTIDNLARPYLARRGRLQLPTYLVLVAMFGGVVALGAWGVLLGPLVVRLAKEALEIVRDARSDIHNPEPL